MAMDLYSSFPIVRKHSEGRCFILGTSFYIGESIFITASHCLNDYQNGDLFLLVSVPGDSAFAELTLVEQIPGCDIAFFKVDLKNDSLFSVRPWYRGRPLLGGSTIAIGFPCLSLTNSREELYTRTISSTVSSIHTYDRLKSNPIILELTSYMPVGMSGSPLEYMPTSKEVQTAGRGHKHLPICGVVIANVSYSTELVRSTETISVNGQERVEVYTKEEVAHFGIAISSEFMLKVQSNVILGGRTLEEFCSQSPAYR